MSDVVKQTAKHIPHLDIDLPRTQINLEQAVKEIEITGKPAITEEFSKEMSSLRNSAELPLGAGMQNELSSLSAANLKLPKLPAGHKFSPHYVNSAADRFITWLAGLIKKFELLLMNRLSNTQSLYRYFFKVKKKKKSSQVKSTLTGLEELEFNGDQD